MIAACAACDGTGAVDACRRHPGDRNCPCRTVRVECRECGGTGDGPDDDMPDDADVCPACGGDGAWGDDPCPDCGGEGWLPAEPDTTLAEE